MRSILIFLMLIVPHIVFAGCILTELPDKFEVVCSGYNPMSPPTDSKMKNSRVSKRSGKVKKVHFEDREGMASNVGMTVEELQFMQARNKMDGFRGKVKPKQQIARN
jgi:hypothetical protein